MSEPHWISFTELTRGKTKVWGVVSKRDAITLGFVQWFARWRCYAFFPRPDMIFSDECLRDLADFCEARTKEHRGTQ